MDRGVPSCHALRQVCTWEAPAWASKHHLLHGLSNGLQPSQVALTGGVPMGVCYNGGQQQTRYAAAIEPCLA